MKNLVLITLTVFLSGAIFTSCSKKEGCTDPAATNFDVDAETDDGSCVYPVAEPEETPVQSVITVNLSQNFDGIAVNAGNFNKFIYRTQDGDTLSITRIRYLLSRITLYKSNGDSVLLKDYHLVDLSDPSTLSFTTAAIDLGSFASVGFTWGFDTTDNSGNYLDLNSASWNWPMMIGGGYHFMQFDGQYMDNGMAMPFNFHNGTASNMGNHEANHAYIRLGGISLNQANVSMEIRMNVAEWFKNPYTWDLNVYSTMLMPNYTAQKMMNDQVQSVFSLGTVSQR